jgi:hypothetical protein
VQLNVGEPALAVFSGLKLRVGTRVRVKKSVRLRGDDWEEDTATDGETVWCLVAE